MVVEAFGGSLGLLMGALGGLLGAFWCFYIDHIGLPDSSWHFTGLRLLAACCLFSFLFVVLSSMSCCIFFRNLLGSILSSQADPPTLKNFDFPHGILTFLKQRRFRSKYGFESALGLSLEHLGSSWGSLGGSLGPLHRPLKASRSLLELSWASFARFLLPKMVLRAFGGRIWLVSGAPRILLGGILLSVKPTLTIKTDLRSFVTLLVSYFSCSL